MSQSVALSLTEHSESGAVSIAQAYARSLLTDLGYADQSLLVRHDEHPALCWAHSGMMQLTGAARATMYPAPIASCADGVLYALAALAPQAATLQALRGSQLLSERAALAGLQRSGSVSPGGSCRLLQAADGGIAINLARPDDWAMLSAWLEEAVDDSWQALEAVVAKHQVASLVARGRLMGLAVAASQPPSRPPAWFEKRLLGKRAVPAKAPLVIDMSSLWAGPLCTHLLQKLGARVIKLESRQRADGARQGNATFYDLLNADKESVSLDLQTQQGRQQLHGLLLQADMVIESARPRGLQQMGILAEESLRQRPGQTWLSITGYGRYEEQADWVGFGDDAAVAAGLSNLLATVTGEQFIVGDAIADPLTGMHAALAVWASHLGGGGQLLSLSLCEVTRHCVSFDLPQSTQCLLRRQQAWSALLTDADIQAPVPRTASTAAMAMGADTDRVLAEFGLNH